MMESIWRLRVSFKQGGVGPSHDAPKGHDAPLMSRHGGVAHEPVCGSFAEGVKALRGLDPFTSSYTLLTSSRSYPN